MTKINSRMAVYMHGFKQEALQIISVNNIALKSRNSSLVSFLFVFLSLTTNADESDNKLFISLEDSKIEQQQRLDSSTQITTKREPSSSYKKNCTTSKIIETTDTALQMDTYDLNCEQQFSDGRGAITDFNGAILLIDSNGEFFKFENLKLIRYAIPALALNLILPQKTIYSEGPPSPHDIVFDKKRNQIFVSFNTVKNEQIYFVVSKYVISQKASKWEIIYQSIPLDAPYFINKAAGGKLLIKGSKLYFSLGDFCLDRKNGLKSDFAAQNSLVPFGKIYSLDILNNDIKLISKGHKNPQGLLFDQSGRFWATEHGPRGGDELNLIIKGSNYGWPYKSLGKSYAEFAPYVKINTNERYTSPVYSWLPSIAPTGIIELKKFLTEWDGDFIIGSLKAQSLFRLHIVGNSVKFNEQIFLGHRIRSVLLMKGKIVILTDDSKLIFLYPRKQLGSSPLFFGASKPFPRRLFGCLICHRFKGSDTTSMAPDFDHLYGRPIATANYSGYSDAFKKVKGKLQWDRDILRAYLNNPGKMINGTSMPNLHLQNDEVTDIIDQLEKIKFDPNFTSDETSSNLN